MRKKLDRLGFKQALEYVLALLCFAYYVKHDSLVSDNCFDELERLYAKMFNKKVAPMRMIEVEMAYTQGVRVVYDWFKKLKQKKK